MRFAESLKMMQEQKEEILRKIKEKKLANSEKNRIFAESEPTALAFTDFSKPMLTLKGEDAERFIENMRKAEEEAERRKNEPPSLEDLKRQYSYGKMVLEMEKENLTKREKELEELRIKIKELEEKNGKTEEG